MSASGVVREWHEELGWGVIVSTATPGGCWTHFSAVRVDGYAVLQVGQDVIFEPEAAEQDGFHFRAVEAWPAGQEPVPPTADEASADAYRSSITLALDDPGATGPD